MPTRSAKKNFLSPVFPPKLAPANGVMSQSAAARPGSTARSPNAASTNRQKRIAGARAASAARSAGSGSPGTRAGQRHHQSEAPVVGAPTYSSIVNDQSTPAESTTT